MSEENNIRKGPSFVFYDINKKRMREIILMCNKKKQKKMLLKSLNIKFTYEEKNRKRVKIHVDNFLPLSINSDMEIIKNYKEILYDDNYCNMYDINKLKIEKMKKIIKDFFYDIFLFCNSYYSEIENGDTPQICSDDVSACQEIKILGSEEYLKGLVTSSVGFIDNYDDKNRGNNFLEVFQKHMNIFDIKKDYVHFKINKYEERTDIEKAFSHIKNNILQKYDERRRGKKKDNDKFIRRVQNMYDDVENKIMSSLKKILDITNYDDKQEKC